MWGERGASIRGAGSGTGVGVWGIGVVGPLEKRAEVGLAGAVGCEVDANGMSLRAAWRSLMVWKDIFRGRNFGGGTLSEYQGMCLGFTWLKTKCDGKWDALSDWPKSSQSVTSMVSGSCASEWRNTRARAWAVVFFSMSKVGWGVQRVTAGREHLLMHNLPLMQVWQHDNNCNHVNSERYRFVLRSSL